MSEQQKNRNTSAAGFFPERIGRLSFLGRQILLYLLCTIAGIAMPVTNRQQSMAVTLAIAVGVLAVAVFIVVCQFGFILVPRLRDVGLHGAFSLLILVPIINGIFFIVLIFLPPNMFTKPVTESPPPQVSPPFPEVVTPHTRTVEVARALDDRFTPPPPPPQSRSSQATPSDRAFFIYLADEVKGPFSADQLKALVAVSTINLDTQCCTQGTQDWFPIRNLI